MTNNIDWDRVQRGLERERHRMIWRPYGMPSIVDLEHSAFHDVPISPPWDIPEKIVITSAITGAFFDQNANPHQPVTQEEIYRQARECAAAGASAIHLHVRDEAEHNTLDYRKFAEVIDPLKREFPDLAVDGCLVAALDGEWNQMTQVLDARLLDAVPVNTAVTYIGDALFAKPIPVILEKARLVQEAGSKVLISAYTDADVSNANRYLLKSGLVPSPSLWCVLPALPGCSPMDNPRQMVDGLTRMVSMIYDADPDATILVCAAGRASSYLMTLAATMGLHIRVGMEDTIWRWPHRNDYVESNLQFLEMAKQLAQVLGREVATHAEYRDLVGLPQAAPVA
jgi:3-keto-5-aminohexanoate cleavage enzyme